MTQLMPVRDTPDNSLNLRDSVEFLEPRPQARLAGEPFHVWTVEANRRWLEFYRIDCGYLLRFPGLADFRLAKTDNEVSCTPSPAVSDTTIEHLYLNQVYPLVQNARGQLLFHGSAVDINGQAVAFVGKSGLGKSTLATSFAISGHPFLSDDALMIKSDAEHHHLSPSHPSIRLWDDSESELLAEEPVSLPTPEYTHKKRFLATNKLPHCSRSKPLAAVYFLGEGSSEAIKISRLDPLEALMRFLNNAFQLDIHDHDTIARDFNATATLCSALECFELDYPRRFDDLARLREVILAHTVSLPPRHTAYEAPDDRRLGR